jgi:hypothetical protein
MKAIIISTAPSPHHYTSVKSFGLANSKLIDGQLCCWQHFNTVNEAREYLKNVAADLYSDEPVDAMNRNLTNSFLFYDSAKASIFTGNRITFFESQFSALSK